MDVHSVCEVNYCGAWCVPLLFEVLVINEVNWPRPSEPGVAESGWSLAQILSSEIMDESFLCACVACIFVSSNELWLLYGEDHIRLKRGCERLIAFPLI